MSEHTLYRNNTERTEDTESRRRELRHLLLTAADTARQTRVRQIAARVARPAGRAIRDRVSTLLSAAG